MSFALVALVACGGEGVLPGELTTTVTQEQAHRRGDDGAVRWVRRSVGAEFETVVDVALDKDGNSILIGSYKGTPSFEGHVLPEPPGDYGQFMVKYSKDGKVRWARSFGGNLWSVAVDSHRRINVVGSSGGAPFSEGAFVAQLSPDGEVRWSRSFQAGGYGIFARGPSVAVDCNDNIVLAGSMMGTLDFGGGPRSVPEESPVVAEYTRDGGYRWDRVFPITFVGYFSDVDTDKSGNVYVVGTVNGPIDLGGGTLTPLAGRAAPVVAKFSDKGSHRWSKLLLPDSGSLMLNGIAVQDNRVAVAGRLDGTMRFAGDVFAAGGGVLLAYTRGGEERWERTLSTGFLVDVVGDHRGDFTALGFAFGDPGDDIDTGSLPGGLTGYLFVAKFDSQHGERSWVRAFGWTAFFLAWPSLAVSREGDVVVGGSFTSTAYFGTETLTPTVPGAYDAFLLRLER